jgi:hypothetical protein
LRRFHYRFFGLTLAANRPLPPLASVAARGADITLEVTTPESLPCRDLAWVMPDPPRPLWRAPGDHGTYLRLNYSGEGASAEFVIDDTGSSVWAAWSESAAPEEAIELLLGPVFTCVMAQRGLTCLHAGVVEIDGRVVALVGPRGSGKSTMALALVHRGAALISDDVAVVTDLDGHPAVSGGAPRIRMRPDSAVELCGSFDVLEPMWVHEERRPAKRYVELPDESAADGVGPFRLDAVYLLVAPDATRQDASIRSVSALDALPRLMADRHMASALDRDGHRRDFACLARVAETVPIREVLRPAGVQTTKSTIDKLLADVHSGA